MRRKFFVSSTFKDFQFERDLLEYEVIPTFRNEARTYGDEADSVDLRWGLDNFGLSESDAANKVIATCFDEIDNSRPFMIIFLGNRWGWVPDQKFVNKKFTKEFETVAGKSVTALEIEYGLNQNTRAVICIRKEIRGGQIPYTYIERDSSASEKLDDLKENLYDNHRGSIIEYTADFNSATGKLENFCAENGQTLAEAILAKLEKYCAEDWNEFEKKPWQQRELDAADNFVKSRAESFVERKNLVAELKGKLENSRGIFLSGEPGSGKTSLACKVAAELRAEGKRVFCISAGTSPLTSNAQSILQLMIYFLAPEYDSAGVPFSRLKVQLYKFCNQISEPVYFIVDAVEMLDADEFRNDLAFLPAQNENAHCLVTCATDFEIPASFFNPSTFFEESMPQLDDKDIEQIIRELTGAGETQDLEQILREGFESSANKYFSQILDEEELQDFLKETLDGENLVKSAVANFREIPQFLNSVAPVIFLKENMPPLQNKEIVPMLTAMLQKNVKELYQPTAEKILEKESATNPLYLEMTAQMLNMIASPELTRLQEPEDIIPLTVDFIENMPDEPEAAAAHIIHEAMTRLEILQPEKVIGSINLLAVSRHGLRMSDLQALLKNKLNPLDWSRVQKYLHNLFVERQSGQIDFSHKIIRAGLRQEIYFPKFTRYELDIAAHFKTLPAGDVIRSAEGFFYAYRFWDLNFAAEFLVEANETKNSALLSSIRELIFDKDGDFSIELLKGADENFDEKTAIGCIRFFMYEFYVMTSVGSAENFKVEQRIFEELARFLKGAELPYYTARLHQAFCEYNLGNIDVAKKICEEIITWGNAQMELKNDSNFCSLLHRTCNLLSGIAMVEGDSSKVLSYAQQAITWLESNEEVDPKFFEIMKLRLDDEDYRCAYELCQKLDLSNELYLLQMVAVSTDVISSNLSSERWDDALTVAQESEEYAHLLLLSDANHPLFLKSAAELFEQISLAEVHAENYEKAYALASESLRLLAQIYLKNSTPENEKLLQNAAIRLKKAMEITGGNFQSSR